MKTITARIIFLASLLAQGFYSVSANPFEGNSWKSKLHNNNYAQIASNNLKPNQSLSGKKGKNSKRKETINTKIRKSPRVSDDIKGLLSENSLYLPKESEEVKVSDLRPLKIEEIENLVEANSPRIKAAKIQIDQSKSLLIAAISRWYPTINLAANGLPEYLSTESYRNPDFSTSLSPSSTNGQQWRASINAQIKWDIIDPGRNPDISAARDTYEKARDSYLITVRDVKLRALTQYFLLQQADEGVRIGKESMRASLLSLRDAKARFDAGVATRLEVLEAETQLARDKQLLSRKLGDQKINRRTLSAILSLPSGITSTAASPARVIGTWKPSLEESIVAAYSFREELDQHLLDISINNNNANLALANSQPIISLVNTLSSARYQGQTGIDASSKVNMDDYGWSITNTIGLNATWNIFDGGRSKALYNYNKQKAKESEANFDAQKNSIRQGVEESFYNLQRANQDISTTTREVIAARESLRLARLRFQAGVTTQREVVNNQRDLTQAEVGYTNAITSYNTSLAQLRRRTGIDHIEACKEQKKQSFKPSIDKKIDIPIEPYPLISPCKASTITK